MERKWCDILSLCKCGVLCVVSYVCSVYTFPIFKGRKRQNTCKYVDVYKKIKTSELN